MASIAERVEIGFDQLSGVDKSSRTGTKRSRATSWGAYPIARRARSAHHPARAQVAAQLLPQCTPRLHEQRHVDRFVGHLHLSIARIGLRQPAGDLLRRPM